MVIKSGSDVDSLADVDVILVAVVASSHPLQNEPNKSGGAIAGVTGGDADGVEDVDVMAVVAVVVVWDLLLAWLVVQLMELLVMMWWWLLQL